MSLIQSIVVAISSLALATALSACVTGTNRTDLQGTRPDQAQTDGSAFSPVPVPQATFQATVQSDSAPTSSTGYRQVVLLENLERPWGIAWLPNGSVLITERPGRLRLVRNGELVPSPIVGVPEVFAVGQGGLLDVAVHPQFVENRLVYLTYAHGTSNANRTRVARARFDGQALQNLEVIFEVSQAKSGSQHFGSRLLWLPDGTLLVTIGDGGNPPLRLEGDLIRKQAQNLRSRLGKIVRLNDDGSIPSGNPFQGRNDADPTIWSYGHRNIQGFVHDPATGRIWVAEHGARGGDELNLIPKAGQNYGWPTVSFSREYATGEPVAAQSSKPGLIDPVLVWTPAIAPSGMAIYTGDRFPQWRGNLFVGGLVSKDVRQIVVDQAGKVQTERKIEIGQRVRDVRQGPDGLLYILTDEDNGRLIRLEPADG